jgi:hypothetical protein
MNKKTHILLTSANEPKKTSYHSPVARTQNSVARTRNTCEQQQQQQLEYDVNNVKSEDNEQIATKHNKNNNQTR